VAHVASGKVTVLPNIPSDNCFGPVWSQENENQASIYRMSLDGKNRKLLVKHARTPSARAVKLRQNGTVMLSGAKHLWIFACEDQFKN
jgi:hypothetical protein